MKKQNLSLFLVITLIFISFTAGFFLGRNNNHEVIHVSALPEEPLHNISNTEAYSTEPSFADISYPLEINTANLEELSSLPGIGSVLAERILHYRNTHGPFEKPEELLNVEGIGSGKLEAILEYIMTGG